MKTLHYIFLLGILFLWSSCNDEKDMIETGYIQLSLDKDLSVITKTSISISEEPLSVEVKNAQGEVVKKYDNFYTEASNSRIALPSGAYTVQAYSKKDIKDAGFDQAYYASPVTSVTVSVGEVQTVKLVCTLANTKVSVEYTEAIQKYFKKYQATISNEYGSILFPESEKRAAYFAPEPLSVKLDLINNTDQKFLVKKEISEVKPRDYFKFRFDIKPSSDNEAGADFDIVIEAMDADTTFVLKIPLSDSSYGKAKPVFEGEEWPSFEVGNSGSGSVKIQQKITSEVGLKSLVLKFPEEIQDLTGVYGSELELSTISSLDLIKLGLTMSVPVSKANEIVLDFTELSKKLSPTSYETKYLVELIAQDTLNQITKVQRNFHIKPNGIYTFEPNAYANFAYLVGGDFLNTSSSTYGFRYREKGKQVYDEVTNGVIRNQDNTFTVRVNGLKAGTTYECQAFTNQKDGQWIEFVTEYEKQMPNSSFDAWFKSGSAWYPNVDLSSDNYWWDSANPGSAGMGVVPTTEEKTVIVKGSSARLATSEVALVGLAAGNIYTGAFGSATMSPIGATLDFGRPFECRPTALEGYYKYAPGEINKAKAPYENKQGETDECSIYILLADWEKPFAISTGEGKFIDYANDPAIIAYGELPDGSAATGSEKNGYKKFSIPLKYRSDRKPKYILVVAASSKLGDYFTGSTSSVLYLDEFSLKYDDTIEIPNK